VKLESSAFMTDEGGRRATRMTSWPAVMGAPIVFLSQQIIAYALVPVACSSQHHWVLSMAPAAGLCVAGAATMAAVQARAAATRAIEAGESARRAAFSANCGIAIGSISCLGIICQWATQLVISPCA
jgi:hypothetical protein